MEGISKTDEEIIQELVKLTNNSKSELEVMRKSQNWSWNEMYQKIIRE